MTALVAQLVEHGSNKPRVGGSSPSWSIYRSYSVMVITKDSDSFNPGSSPGRTFLILAWGMVRPTYRVSWSDHFAVPVAQLDKASDYESEDWGFKSLQGYLFICGEWNVDTALYRTRLVRRYSSVGRASD